MGSEEEGETYLNDLFKFDEEKTCEVEELAAHKERKKN